MQCLVTSVFILGISDCFSVCFYILCGLLAYVLKAACIVYTSLIWLSKQILTVVSWLSWHPLVLILVDLTQDHEGNVTSHSTCPLVDQSQEEIASEVKSSRVLVCENLGCSSVVVISSERWYGKDRVENQTVLWHMSHLYYNKGSNLRGL